jgi:ketosteroid isomerase-like protein
MPHRPLIVAVLVLGLQAPLPDPQALQRMVAAERAFAAATAEIGVRDGFLTFFAADSIEFEQGRGGTRARVVQARESLVRRPLIPLPLAGRLMWEPFTGQVSDDGRLGWLTGPFVTQEIATKTITRQGAYFSVWKKQPDGTWRVWLDEGITIPRIWSDPIGFRAAPAPDAGAAGSPTETIDAAERAVASGGAAWRDRLSAGVRLHRESQMPIVGNAAAADWAAREWASVRYTVLRTEPAASGDLAVTLGGYDAVTARGPHEGTWVRVWKRAASGRWRIVFETGKAVK